MRTLTALLSAAFILAACSKPAPVEPKKDEAPKVEEVKKDPAKGDEKKAEPAKTTDEKTKPAPPTEMIEAAKGAVKVEAGASPCDTCVKVGAWIITKVGCGAGEAALDVACTAAEIAFPEFDEIIGPLCTAMEIGLPAVCEELGPDVVKHDPSKAAKLLCSKAGLCK